MYNKCNIITFKRSQGHKYKIKEHLYTYYTYIRLPKQNIKTKQKFLNLDNQEEQYIKS